MLHIRSLIASYLGNIVGALLVALPAWYFYLRDYDPALEMERVERGERDAVTEVVANSVSGSLSDRKD